MIIKKSNKYNDSQKVLLNVSLEIKDNNTNNNYNSGTSTSRGDSNSESNKIGPNLYVDGNIYVNNSDYSYEDDDDDDRNIEDDDETNPEEDLGGEGNIIAGGDIICKDIYPKEHYYINVNNEKKDLLTEVIKPISDDLAAHIISSNKKFNQVDSSISDISSRLKQHIDDISMHSSNNEYFNSRRESYLQVWNQGDLVYSEESVLLGEIEVGELDSLTLLSVTLDSATYDTAGLMSANDKRLLNLYDSDRGIYLIGNEVNYNSSYIELGSFNRGPLDDLEIGCPGLQVNAATVTTAGVMTAEDKRNLIDLSTRLKNLVLGDSSVSVSDYDDTELRQSISNTNQVLNNTIILANNNSAVIADISTRMLEVETRVDNLQQQSEYTYYTVTNLLNIVNDLSTRLSQIKSCECSTGKTNVSSGLEGPAIKYQEFWFKVSNPDHILTLAYLFDKQIPGSDKDIRDALDTAAAVNSESDYSNPLCFMDVFDNEGCISVNTVNNNIVSESFALKGQAVYVYVDTPPYLRGIVYIQPNTFDTALTI